MTVFLAFAGMVPPDPQPRRGMLAVRDPRRQPSAEMQAAVVAAIVAAANSNPQADPDIGNDE